MQNHHQALIVFLSYVIGFITAFIMFGLGDEPKNIVQDYSEHRPTGPFTVVSPAPRLLEETEEGLLINLDGEQRIISASTDSEVAEPGFHVAMIHSVMSPSLKYAYFCAQIEKDSEECQNFVYSVDEHKTYPVKDSAGNISTSSTVGLLLGTWSSDEDVLFLSGQRTTAELNWILERDPNASVGYPSDI